MSEPEDDRLLRDEIKALEDILAASGTPESPVVVDQRDNLNHSPRRTSVSSRGFGEVTHYDEPQSSVNEYETACPKSALEANRKLLELLKESKRELVAMLEKCLENKAIVNEKIKERAKNAKPRAILIGSAGMPYFKDLKQYSAPRNEDALEKVRNGEVQMIHLRKTRPWTVRDRNILLKAIQQEAINSELADPDQGDASNAAGSIVSVRDRGNSGKWGVQTNWKALIGPLGAKEFDWMKIASMDFDNKHTAEECKVLWKVYLHPEISRYRWLPTEVERLIELSTKYNFQNWDAVAKELGTNRSGYQCFVKYKGKNKNICVKESAWSKEEDNLLQECVEWFKVGHYIPWGTVTKYLEGRSKAQVYYRWKYNRDPHLKKGRFTAEENATLLDAVKKHGTNFSKISSSIMPNRSSVQLSEHYLTLINQKRGNLNTWTIDDDARIVKLYKKYGTDWSKIAEKFPGKTRTQVRHRHKSILRYFGKGLSIYEIPRPLESTAKNSNEINSAEIIRVERIHAKQCKELNDVDLDLIKYFQLAPPSNRPGRKQKFYKDQELKDTTRKLAVLLNTLNANLEISEEFDDRTLTEKDKQLLVSFKKFQRSRINSEKSHLDDEKYARIYDKDTTKDGILHFTPVCSGNCKTKSTNGRLLLGETLDYVKPTNLDCQIKLNLQLETPRAIINRIGDEKNNDFDRLTKILKTKKIETRKPTVVTKIRVLGPGMWCLPKVPNAENLPDDENAAITKKARRRNRGKTWDSSTSEGIIHADEDIDYVEPNYFTMLGLQHILSGNEDTEESRDNRDTVSKECKKSMETLKTRLIQLFKYPIGLSHILRPEIYATQLRSNEIVNSDDNDEDSAVVTTPPAKTRRITKNKCVNEKKKKVGKGRQKKERFS